MRATNRVREAIKEQKQDHAKYARQGLGCRSNGSVPKASLGLKQKSGRVDDMHHSLL